MKFYLIFANNDLQIHLSQKMPIYLRQFLIIKGKKGKNLRHLKLNSSLFQITSPLNKQKLDTRRTQIPFQDIKVSFNYYSRVIKFDTEALLCLTRMQYRYQSAKTMTGETDIRASM